MAFDWALTVHVTVLSMCYMHDHGGSLYLPVQTEEGSLLFCVHEQQHTNVEEDTGNST